MTVYVTFQTARKCFYTRRIVVGTLNSSIIYSQTDLWASIGTHDCSEHLVTLGEPTLQLELIDLYCSDELGCKFKEGDAENL